MMSTGEWVSSGKDGQRTREAILEAAQQIFSMHGYQDAGVRDITARAGVSPALVNRYFGSKEKLFEEALAGMLDTAPLQNMQREAFGEAVVDLLYSAVDRSAMPLPMFMLASGDPGARAIAQQLITNLVYEPLAAWLGAEEGRVRAARFMIVSAGLAVYSHIYALDVVAPHPDPNIRAWLVREFQSLVA